jgi:hypothetical protein
VYQESREIILGLIQKGLENSTEVIESEQIVGGGQRVCLHIHIYKE